MTYLELEEINQHLRKALDLLYLLLANVGRKGICRHCGGDILLIWHKDGHRARYNLDGTSHSENCTKRGNDDGTNN